MAHRLLSVGEHTHIIIVSGRLVDKNIMCGTISRDLPHKVGAGNSNTGSYVSLKVFVSFAHKKLLQTRLQTY